MRRYLNGFLCFALWTAASCAGQTPAAASLQFEVASIRPHAAAPDEPSNRLVKPGGRFVATNTTVRALLRNIFGVDDNRITGVPKWVDSDVFDITAVTADHAEIQTPEDLQRLILALLEERCQLKYHRGSVEGPVFRMELEKPGTPGPALKPSDPATKTGMSTNGNNGQVRMRVAQMSMDGIAKALSRQLGRPVEDHTGLTGKYDFTIEWSRDDLPDATVPSLSTVMREQLGLRVRPAKGTYETVVIDHIERPSDN